MPSTAQPTSVPTIACSIRTLPSYCRAAAMAASSSSARSTLVTPKDEPERAGFTNTGYAKLVRRGDVGAVQDRERGSVDPRVPCDDVRERLVHADRRALDVAAHVGDPGQLEQSLHRPVLTRLAVQDREHRVDVHRSALAALADEQSVRLSVRRDHGSSARAVVPSWLRPLAHLPDAGLVMPM